MAQDHPTAEQLEEFLQSAPGRRSESTRIVRHLLAGCQPCNDSLQAKGWPEERLDRLLHLAGGHRDQVFEAGSPTWTGYDYDSAFEQVEQSLADFLVDTPPPAEPMEILLAELDVRPLASQEALIAASHRFADPQLVRCLVERSHEARYENPEAMLHWASLARVAAGQCDPSLAGSAARLEDLRARSWGQYGNALRVCGRLPEAQEAMTNAHTHLAAGTGDPALRARLSEQKASLLSFHRSFEDAIRVLKEAAEVYRELGDTHSLARTLVQEAIACLYSGDPEGAVDILNRAIPLIDQEDDPHLLLAACHNIVRCYIDLDQPEKALSLYLDAQELYSEFKDALILLRAAWQQGQLLRDMGHLRAAEATLLRARKGFMERDLAYEVALISLDLSAVYVKLGSTEEVKQTASEVLPIFQALGVGREMLMSLLQLQQIADQQQRALELIRVMTSQLEHMNKRLSPE